MADFRLRPLMEKDAQYMCEWMKDPSIVCFFRFDASSVSEESCRKFIGSANNDENCRHYAIVNESDEYLGTISLKDIDYTKKQAEYAISTRSCAHGTGASTVATKEIFRIAFEELGLEKVYLNVLVGNLRANGFYRKIGFVFDKIEKNALNIKGVNKDLNWYFINKEEYLEKF